MSRRSCSRPYFLDPPSPIVMMLAGPSDILGFVYGNFEMICLGVECVKKAFASATTLSEADNDVARSV
jgi:hypothetical protein